MQKNIKIRQALLAYGVKHWELADLLEIAPESLSRKLRYELPEQIQTNYINMIIDFSKKHRK